MLKRIIFILYFLISNAWGIDSATSSYGIINATANNSSSLQSVEIENSWINREFATYKENTPLINPQVKPYKVASDLSNITNKNDFQFTDAQKKLLIKNAFVVVPKDYLEFFEVYEGNRYGNLPNFITTDSLLHNYHLLYKRLLSTVEQEKLLPELKKLSIKLLNESQNQYQQLKGTEWENAAKRNVAFFAIGAKLLSTDMPIPILVRNEANAELKLISEHKDITLSPTMNLGNTKKNLMLEGFKEDYSQYLPRGHYTFSEKTRNYFKAMEWYGRLTFRLKNPDEVRSAALIILALNNQNNIQIWEKIYSPISFFVGKSDDINYYQINEIMNRIYGSRASLDKLVKDSNKFSILNEEINKLEPPQINSIPIFYTVLQPNREKEIKGFRFLGQRFTIDSAIFQQLIVRAVGPKNEKCTEQEFESGRTLPKSLDIPAAFGSKAAAEILKAEGEFAYACYPENLNKIQNYITKLPQNIWTQNLYWAWLYSLLPLTEAKPEGYPAFMLNIAWSKKELNTFLGNWSELKHDTMLYTKQVYAEMGDGMEEKDDRGYVEPNVEVYTRLASLLDMTISGLESHNLLSTKNKELLNLMKQLTLKLKTISEKELQNIKLNDQEYELIRSYGGQLEHFWLEALHDEGIKSTSQLINRPAAIISDVATDPNGLVLEEATGHISEIYVVIPIDGKLRIASGGVYSYYEFSWPLQDRLTDEKWHAMLLNNKAPRLPEWTTEFIANEK